MTTTGSKKKSVKVAEEAAEVAVEATNNDVDVLTNTEPDRVELSSGSVVRVQHIKTRETFALLRIITHGAGGLLGEIAFNREDTEAFAGQLIGLLITAVPDAYEEAMDFVRLVVLPEGFIDKAKTKEQRRHNEELLEALYEELDNPELDDTVAIIIAVIKNEAPHLMALGKRLAALFSMNLG